MTIHRLIISLLVSCLLSTSASANISGEADFIALCYHNVVTTSESVETPRSMDLTVNELVQQFNWLKSNRYQTISIAQLKQAREGGATLPAKALLLTFDDGYQTFYRNVFPLLKLYNFHAVIAITGQWMTTDANGKVSYGKQQINSDEFLSWEQIREMQASGLVEVASHSYDLHKFVSINTAGSEQPAAVSLAHQSGDNESLYGYRIRLMSDLYQNNLLISNNIGTPPSALMWPYGEYNHESEAIAQKVGINLSFTLGDGFNRLQQALPYKRALIQHHMPIKDFVSLLQTHDFTPAIRALQVDLDYVDDVNPVQREKNLQQLIDYLKQVGANTIYLQAFADTKGDSLASSLYFPNRHLPVKRDLFSHVANRIKNQTGAKVYAWMPILSYNAPDESWKVVRLHRNNKVQRLSPFNQSAMNYVREIFEDLAWNTPIDGILFHDDGHLNDYEDFNSDAITAMRENGLPGSLKQIKSDPRLYNLWTELKTIQLTRWTAVMTAAVRKVRPRVKTARNLFSQPVLNLDARHWYAQQLNHFEDNYDYVAILAMPWMEQARKPEKWMHTLLKQLDLQQADRSKLILTLQTTDWRKRRKLAPEQTKKLMQIAETYNVRHFALYPADFIHNSPNANNLSTWFSSASFPFRR